MNLSPCIVYNYTTATNITNKFSLQMFFSPADNMLNSLTGSALFGFEHKVLTAQVLMRVL